MPLPTHTLTLCPLRLVVRAWLVTGSHAGTEAHNENDNSCQEVRIKRREKDGRGGALGFTLRRDAMRCQTGPP